jgi:hypothetical protein
VLILAHVKELLEQAAEKLRTVAPDLPVGIYSAGLKRRDLGYAVTVAGIQSVYQKACDLGAVDLIIVDEAHLIPPDGEGMYRQFLADARQSIPTGARDRADRDAVPHEDRHDLRTRQHPQRDLLRGRRARADRAGLPLPTAHEGRL